MNNEYSRELPLPKIGRQVAFLETDDIFVRKGEGAFLGLKDGSIIHAYTEYCGGDVHDHGNAHIAYVRSTDRGETWTYEGVLLEKGEGAINIMSVSFLRLPSDEILIFYMKKTARAGSIDCLPYVRSSFDEGKTWGPERCCMNPAEGYFILNNDRVIRLQSGRILFAMGTRARAPFQNYGETTTFVASDDDGKTWQKLPQENRMPFENIHGFEEPGLYQHENGKIWGYTRTDIGCQFMFESTDDGASWSTPTPSTFFTGARSPMLAKKVCGKYTVAIFNPIQLYTGRNLGGIRGRAPYVMAVSTDDGTIKGVQSFSRLFFLEDDMDNDYCYPAIYDGGDYFLVAYYHSNGRQRPLNCLKIVKILPEELQTPSRYKMVASDLDGTLLNSHEQVSRENWDAIAKLQQQNIHFVPASGRAWAEMPAFLRESDLIRYYITSDGTMIYDKEQQRIVWEQKISKETAKWLLDELYKHDVCLMLHDDMNSYFDRTMEKEEVYARMHMGRSWVDLLRAANVILDNYKEFVYGLDGFQMVCAFFSDHDELLACKALFSNHPELIVVQSDPNNLEIYCRQAGKGKAMRELAHILGFPYKLAIAVGDSTNDSEMVGYAGLGLAMENAVPALKEKADFVICNNNAHAINYILEHYI